MIRHKIAPFAATMRERAKFAVPRGARNSRASGFAMMYLSAPRKRARDCIPLKKKNSSYEAENTACFLSKINTPKQMISAALKGAERETAFT